MHEASSLSHKTDPYEKGGGRGGGREGRERVGSGGWGLAGMIGDTGEGGRGRGSSLRAPFGQGGGGGEDSLRPLRLLYHLNTTYSIVHPATPPPSPPPPSYTYLTLFSSSSSSLLSLLLCPSLHNSPFSSFVDTTCPCYVYDIQGVFETLSESPAAQQRPVRLVVL